MFFFISLLLVCFLSRLSVSQNCSDNFHCSATFCIDKVNPECDGVADCPNQEDERNCGRWSISRRENTHLIQ